jgi:hypothetical protein
MRATGKVLLIVMLPVIVGHRTGKADGGLVLGLGHDGRGDDPGGENARGDGE